MQMGGLSHSHLVSSSGGILHAASASICKESNRCGASGLGTEVEAGNPGGHLTRFFLMTW